MKADIQSSEPVFIVGSPRCGSSMIHWSLLQSDAFWGSAESDFLHAIAPAVAKGWERGTRQGEFSWLNKEGVSEEEFFRAVGEGIDALYRSRAGGARWVDQTPFYVAIAGHLAKMFPAARFLCLFRDGRQATPSIQALLGHDFDSAVFEWARACRQALELVQVLPDRCLPVCYEDLVLNTDEALRDVFRFLNESFTEDAVSFIRDKSPINSSFEQESSLDKLAPRWLDWPRRWRKRFHRTSEGMLQRLGYELDEAWVKQPFSPDSELVARRVRDTLKGMRADALRPGPG